MNKNILISGIILIACLSVFLNAASSSLYWEARGLDPYAPEFWSSLDYLTLTAEDWKNIDFTLDNFPWASFDINKMPKFDFVNIEPKQARAIFKNEFNVDFEMSKNITSAVYESKNKTLGGNFGSFNPSDYPEDRCKIELVKIGEEESLVIIPKKEDGTLDTENQITLLGGGKGSLFKIDESGLMEVYLKEGQDIRIDNKANMKIFLNDGSTYFIEDSTGSFTFDSTGKINAEDANMHLEMFNKEGEKIKDFTGSFKMKDDIVMLTKKDSTYDDLILDLHFKSNNQYSPELVIVPTGIDPNKWPLEDISFWKRKGTAKDVHIYGYAEVSENFVSLQGNGYIDGREGKIKINSLEPIANPNDFKTNREFVYNYINKGEEALAGQSEDKKITTPLAIIDVNNKYDYAFGKVSLEDNEIAYSGLTSSTQFSKSSEDETDKDLVRIDGVQDGKIAVFGRETQLNIIKDGDYVGIDANAMELLNDYSYAPDRELEMILGNEENGAYFLINSDGEKTYNPGEGRKVTILSGIDALGTLGNENSVLIKAQKLIDSSSKEDGITYTSTREAQEIVTSLDSYIKNYEGIDEERVLKAKIKRAELVMNYELESYENSWFEKLVQEYPEEEYQGTLQKNAMGIAKNLLLNEKVDYAQKFYRNVVDIKKDSNAGLEALNLLDKSASVKAIQYAKMQATENFMRRIGDIEGYKNVLDKGFFGDVLNNAKNKFQSGQDPTKIVNDLLSEIYGGAGPAALALGKVRDERVKGAEYELATALSALNIVEKTMNNGANDFEEAFAILENDAISRNIQKVGNWQQSTIPDFSVDINLPPSEMKKLFGTESKYSVLGVTSNDLHYLVHDDPYFSNFLKVIQSGNAGTEEEERAWLEAARSENLRGNLAGAIAIAKNVGDRTSNPEIQAEAYKLYSFTQGPGAALFFIPSKPEELAKVADNLIIDSLLVNSAVSKLTEFAGKATMAVDTVSDLSKGGLIVDNFDDAYSIIKYADNMGDARSVQKMLIPGMCSVEGTKITMFDGSIKNVEDIKTGDIVLSYDIENKRFIAGEVLSGAFERRTDELIIINEHLKITAEHPIFVLDKEEYVNAGDLSSGDVLIDSDGNTIIVKSIKKEKLQEKISVYNFDVDNEYDNYFAENILIENVNPLNPCMGARDSTEILPPMKKYGVDKYTISETASITPLEEVAKYLNNNPNALVPKPETVTKLATDLKANVNNLIIPGTTQQGGVMKDMPLSSFAGRPSQESFFTELARTKPTTSSIPGDVKEIGERLPYFSDVQLNPEIIEKPSVNLIGNIEVADYQSMTTSRWMGSSNTEKVVNVVRVNEGGKSRLVAIDRVSVTNLKGYYDNFRSARVTKTAEGLKTWVENNCPRLVVFDAGRASEGRIVANIEKTRQWLNTQDTLTRLKTGVPRIYNVLFSQ